MVRFLFLILIILTGAKAQILTRSYYVGKDQVNLWQTIEHDLNHPNGNPDPFAPGAEMAPPPKPLKKAPFKSPHFRKGDDLFDFKVYKERLKKIQGKLAHLIYNESTGRLIIQGEPEAHSLVQSLAIRSAEDCPRLVNLIFEFWEDGALIFSTSTKGSPGIETTAKVGGGANVLNLKWEPQIYSEDNFVDLQLSVNGKIRNQDFKLKSGFILLNDQRQTITLGKTDEAQKTLTFSITPQVLLHGEVRISDLILDENGKSLKRQERTNIHHDLFQKGIPDPKTGQVLKAFRVPPTFMTFISTASNHNEEQDPFEATETPKVVMKEQFVSSPDPRIPAWPSDRLFDLKDLLKRNGVSIKPSDFAVLNIETDTLYVLADPLEVELVEGIVMPVGSWGMERYISVKLEHVESSTKPTTLTLDPNDHKILAQLSTAVLPGATGSLTLGSHHLDIESQIDADDRLIESFLTFQIKPKRKPTLLLKSRLFHRTGVPNVVQSTFQNGKWRSLILTAKIEDPRDPSSSK